MGNDCTESPQPICHLHIHFSQDSPGTIEDFVLVDIPGKQVGDKSNEQVKRSQQGEQANYFVYPLIIGVPVDFQLLPQALFFLLPGCCTFFGLCHLLF